MTKVRKWLPLLAVCMGTFMLLIDVTVVNVALPQMASSLHTSFSSLQWVVDAYALALAALVLGTGSLGDLTGHRQTYVGGLAVFAVSSLVCGLAPNAGLLITARLVQGAGAAAMFATTVALLTGSYSGRDRGTAFGMWGAVAGASAAVGPIIGGVLTQLVSWRWIFFVNLPVSAAAIALCLRVLPDEPRTGRAKVDVLGMAFFSAAAGELTYAMIRANDHHWLSRATLNLVAAAVLLLIGFVMVERRVAQPLFDLGLLRNKPFVGVLVSGIALNFAAFAGLTYVSIWLQSVLGMSPIESGLTGLPLSLATFVTSAGIGRRLHSSPPGKVIGIGLLLIGAGGLMGALFVHGGANWPALMPGYALIGVGVGLAIPISNAAAMDQVPPHRRGMASGSVRTMQQLGYAFGIALLGTVFAARARHVVAGDGLTNVAGIAHAVAGGQAPGLLAAAPPDGRVALDSTVHAAAVSGLQSVLALSGILGVLAGLAVLALMRSAPAPEHATIGQQPAPGPTVLPAADGPVLIKL
ncbi:MAG TPA: MFS transporter [Sporichthyaceae bacterium]